MVGAVMVCLLEPGCRMASDVAKKKREFASASIARQRFLARYPSSYNQSASGPIPVPADSSDNCCTDALSCVAGHRLVTTPILTLSL